MRELPSGTVTFLFSDIEGSTRLLQEVGDAYAGLLGDHHRRLRGVFAMHGGVEVGTQGDAFFVAFSRASGALAAAADVHEVLRDGPIRVRVGLHTGEPLLTEGGTSGSTFIGRRASLRPVTADRRWCRSRPAIFSPPSRCATSALTA